MGDWAVIAYASSRVLPVNVRQELLLRPKLDGHVTAMLSIEPLQRPTAKYLSELWTKLKNELDETSVMEYQSPGSE